MKHPNRLLSFQYKEDALNAEFRSYLTLKIFTSWSLLTQGLSFEEIDSALFPMFLKERKKYRKQIIAIQWNMIDILFKIRDKK